VTVKTPINISSSHRARRILLDAVTYYQRSLARVQRVDEHEARSLLAGAEIFASQFAKYDERGWPPFLGPLAEEVRHLATRFEAAVAGRFPGLATDGLDELRCA
jgi:hypothetical protein